MDSDDKTMLAVAGMYFVFIYALVLTLVLAGCAAPMEPYTHERPTQPFHVTMAVNGVDSWTADGAPTVLSVYNPTKSRVQMHVVCEPSVPVTSIDRGHDGWWLCLEAGGEVHRLVEFMNIDAMTQVCHVKTWWRINKEWACVEGGGG